MATSNPFRKWNRRRTILIVGVALVLAGVTVASFAATPANADVQLGP